VLSNGNIVVADSGNNCIRIVTPTGIVVTLAGQTTAGSSDGTGAAASFNFPMGLAIHPTGNIVVADNTNNCIRLVTQSGVVTTLAGSGSPAFADGTGAGASFQYPCGVAVFSSGKIIVADSGNNRIRLIT
jgi:DNA-binding beta-propeller fold protein YncE